MSNTFTKPSDLIAGTTARAEDINNRVDATETGFDNVEAVTNRTIKLPVGTSGDQLISESGPNRALKEVGFDANGDLVLISSAFQWKGDWTTSTAYIKNDMVRDSSTKNLYTVQSDHTSGVLATDVSGAKLSLAINVSDVETAKAAAQTAQAAAELAETNAETAETNAELAETNAETAETNAETAETNAAASASSATASAATATTKASTATTQASTATTKASEASTSATNAASSETNAASSATTAATQATNSSSSATASAVSAATATTKASTATTKASEASTSASNASTSETNAASSASTASTKASQASTSETNAASSETNAASSASSASSSASTATTQASTATTKASEASTSATNAASSATSAASSASTATTQASTATTKASEASTSETNASTSETNAASSATAAASSATSSASSATTASNAAASAASALDSFDDRYLGVKTSAPSTDNDGNALLEGALYFDSTANGMKVYDGANWIAASSSGNISFLKYKYVATSNQTTFSGSDSNNATLSYTVGNIVVILNGIVLDASDFTATNSTSLILASGASTGDELAIRAYKSFTTADMVPASTGGTFGGDVKLGDNVKAKFGNSDDLVIYHDNAVPATYIKESGSGDLKISGNNLWLNDATGNTYFRAVNNSYAKMYHAGYEKLATTSSGVDISGTLAADKLVSQDGIIELDDNGTHNGIINSPASLYVNIDSDNSNTGEKFVVAKDRTSTSGGTELFKVEEDGDISFYDDSGSAKFFWDASAESLGIGNVQPSATYSLDAAKAIRVSSVSPSFALQETDTSNQQWSFGSYGGTAAIRDISNGNYPLQIEAATPSNTLFLDSSGNVGIGTSSPDNTLTVAGNITQLNGSPEYHFATTNATHTNWRIAAQESVSNGFEIASGTETAGTNANSDTYTARLVVLNTGNVGIGSSSPSNFLSVRDGMQVGEAYQAAAATGIASNYCASFGRSAGRSIHAMGSIDIQSGYGVEFGTGGSANTLDDYESGYWTPTLNGVSGSVFKNSYVKVGNQVTVTAFFSSISWNTGANTVGGLPFTNGYGHASVYSPSNSVVIQQATVDGTQIKFRAATSGSSTYLLVAATYIQD